jgi:hypothetical protein
LQHFTGFSKGGLARVSIFELLYGADFGFSFFYSENIMNKLFATVALVAFTLSTGAAFAGSHAPAPKADAAKPAASAAKAAASAAKK